jgi:predicted transcriptional regulator
MVDTSEEALLLALETHEDLFSTIDKMLSSENYLKVLMVIEEDKTYADMSDEAGVAQGTVGNAISELQEFGLVEETNEGYKRTLSVLGHPLIQQSYWDERDDDD